MQRGFGCLDNDITRDALPKCASLVHQGTRGVRLLSSLPINIRDGLKWIVEKQQRVSA